MTDNNHPITPPPELFAEWFTNSLKTLDKTVSTDDRGTTGLIAGEVAIQAARWGADMELEACCSWADATGWCGAGDMLRTDRRSEPPSLKEQALQALDLLKVDASTHGLGFDSSAIRRALESLPD